MSKAVVVWKSPIFCIVGIIETNFPLKPSMFGAVNDVLNVPSESIDVGIWVILAS